MVGHLAIFSQPTIFIFDRAYNTGIDNMKTWININLDKDNNVLAEYESNTLADALGTARDYLHKYSINIYNYTTDKIYCMSTQKQDHKVIITLKKNKKYIRNVNYKLK